MARKTTPRSKTKSQKKAKAARARLTPKQARSWAIAGAVALVVLIAAFVGVARATDASSYCKSCHEMQPYHDAWSTGPHARHAECVQCHVNAGFVPRLVHKFPALLEVWSHFSGNSGFPLPKPANVPDSRCRQCHQTVTVKNPPAGFFHDFHEKQGTCQMCHATTGHDVSAQALQAAGVFNARNATMRAAGSAGATATVNGGQANLTGHVTVVCSRCHDMATTPCGACHTAPHEARGDCAQCHKPGKTWTFEHPATRMKGWQNMPCVKCHPVSYAEVDCTCHKGNPPNGD